MKKAIVIFVILTLNFELSTFNCFAQPNGGFESWSPIAGIDSPDNWQTLNFLTVFSNPASAFKASGTDKHSGDWALKLKTIYLNHNPVANGLTDTTGGAFLGKLILSPISLKPGIPYTGRPEKLEFWSKYIPIGNDRGGAFVTLQKWNGTGHDTIATGDVQLDSTVSYTFFQVYINYFSAELPDTLIILFTPSIKPDKARVGSTLYIDDVALTGWVGINEPTNFANKVKIFPNPAKDNVTIHAQIDDADKVQVVDASGKLIGVYQIQNYGANINTSTFAGGIYFFEIRDKKEKILTQGKFNVTK